MTVLRNLFNVVKPEWLIQRCEVDLTEVILGNGGWGRVVRATFRGEQVAAKCLHNQIISEYNILYNVLSVRCKSPHNVTIPIY